MSALQKPRGGYAVMAEKKDRRDFREDFPTPPWATRALVEWIIQPGSAPLQEQTAWEPSCNRGFMAKPLAEYFGKVHTSDIFDYGWSGQQRVEDFLMPSSQPPGHIHWTISNPPFGLAAQFIFRALDVSPNVAMLVRTSFLEGADRYANLFKRRAPTLIAQFAERVPMVKGRHDPAASTATAYCWIVWCQGDPGTRFQWIPPCRRQLQRAEDAPSPALSGEAGR